MLVSWKRMGGARLLLWWSIAPSIPLRSYQKGRKMTISFARWPAVDAGSVNYCRIGEIVGDPKRVEAAKLARDLERRVSSVCSASWSLGGCVRGLRASAIWPGDVNKHGASLQLMASVKEPGQRMKMLPSENEKVILDTCPATARYISRIFGVVLCDYLRDVGSYMRECLIVMVEEKTRRVAGICHCGRGSCGVIIRGFTSVLNSLCVHANSCVDALLDVRSGV